MCEVCSPFSDGRIGLACRLMGFVTGILLELASVVAGLMLMTLEGGGTAGGGGGGVFDRRQSISIFSPITPDEQL